MGLPQQAIDSIVKLSSKKRFEHAIKTIAGAEALYVLNGNDDWLCLYDDDGGEYLMIFPESDFAELAMEWNPEANGIEEVELENFLEDTVPFMKENQVKLAVFPKNEDTDTVILDPIEFAKIINSHMSEWYGEVFELDYLD